MMKLEDLEDIVKTVCFFHRADFDGKCSGAIVKMAYPDCELIGVDYGDAIPTDKIENADKVFIVDFSFSIPDMVKIEEALKGRGGELVWIDHHKTALDAARAAGFHPDGARLIGKGACRLTWEYYVFPGQAIPLAVSLLSAYDVFDLTDPRTLEFQYGLRLEEDTRPDNQSLWSKLFASRKTVMGVVENGKIILRYVENENRGYCRAYAFETTLEAPKGIVFDPRSGDPSFPYRAIAVNRGMANSKLFDSVFDPEKHDLMIIFCRHGGRREWKVSLYAADPGVDCGAIAKVFGGGGHVSAAGFSCEELPFQI
jgi:hypothetical protein